MQPKLKTGESLWESLWLFCVVLDEDTVHLESLVGFWRDDDGSSRSAYWIPDDEDTTVSLIDIDHPPMEDVAWDAKGVAA